MALTNWTLLVIVAVSCCSSVLGNILVELHHMLYST